MVDWIVYRQKTDTANPNEWEFVEDFSGINAYSEADEFRGREQAANPGYRYTVIDENQIIGLDLCGMKLRKMNAKGVEG